MKIWKSVSAVVGAVALVAVGAVAPASAATLDAFTLSSTSTTAGASVTATASFVATETTEYVEFVFDGAAASSLSFTGPASTPTGSCSTGPNSAACLLVNVPIGAAITLTATLNTAASTPPGDYWVQARAGAILGTQTLSVVPDTPPILDSIGPQTVAEGTTLGVDIQATDPDGDSVSFAASSLPPFATLVDHGNGTATVTLSPDYTQAGTYSATVAAFNGGGFDPETFSITVTNVDRPPVLDPIGAQTVAEGATVDVTVTGSDPDGDVASFVGVALPPFATLTDNNDGTATLRLAPTLTDAGTYSATVAAFNGGGNDPETFPITVTNLNQAPVLAPIGAQTVAEGSTLVIPVSATDPDTGDTLQFLPSSLPSFATFTDNGDGTGSLTLTPSYTDAGSYSILMLVTDSFLDDTETFALTVTDTNRAPVISGVPPQVVADGTTSSVTVTATDPDGDPLTLFSGALPSWASFTDNGDGTGTLTFAPTAADVGDTWSIGVSAEDPDGAGDSTTVEASVVDATAPTIFPPADITTTATSAAGATVTYAVTALDAVDGALTPDCLPPSGSIFPVGATFVSCTVTDLEGNQSAASFAVTVLPPSAGGSAGGAAPGADRSPGAGGESLAATGGTTDGQLTSAALLMLLAGVLVVHVTRRRA